MTVEDILKQSGMTAEQIAALDAKVLSGFGSVLSTSQQAREQAELAQRAQQDLYKTQIAPALDSWAVEKAQKDAEIAYYKTQAEGAKAGGFLPKDAPGYVAPRATDGTFVAGANAVPGSPAMTDIVKAMSNVAWVNNEHIRLHGQPMPDDFDTVLRESTEAHLPFRDYVSKKYGFEAKRAEIAAGKQKAHDDAIRAEATAAANKDWSERVGNNPNVRAAMPSQYADLNKAIGANTRKDPLSMSESERRQQTSQHIQKEIVERMATVN